MFPGAGVVLEHRSKALGTILSRIMMFNSRNINATHIQQSNATNSRLKLMNTNESFLGAKLCSLKCPNIQELFPACFLN
jgi:hypothetical protein